MKISKSWNRHL